MLVNDVKLALVAEETPENGDDLANDNEWNGGQRAEDAQDELNVAQTSQGKRTYGADDVQIDIHRAHIVDQKIQCPM